MLQPFMKEKKVKRAAFVSAHDGKKQYKLKIEEEYFKIV